MKERLQVGTETRSTLQILTPFQALSDRHPEYFSGVQRRLVKSFKAYKVLQFFQWFLPSDETFVSKVPMDGNEMD